VLDHFTKYLWAEAFKTKEAPKIAKYLLTIFRDGICFPERWHADNGGEFKNFYIDAVRELLAVNGESKDGLLLPYSHSMPRNPQCQGLVERGNCTLKTSVVKQMAAHGYKVGEHTTWDWRPYMKRQVQHLNRKSVPMYRCTSTRKYNLHIAQICILDCTFTHTQIHISEHKFAHTSGFHRVC